MRNLKLRKYSQQPKDLLNFHDMSEWPPLSRGQYESYLNQPKTLSQSPNYSRKGASCNFISSLHIIDEELILKQDIRRDETEEMTNAARQLPLLFRMSLDRSITNCFTSQNEIVNGRLKVKDNYEISELSSSPDGKSLVHSGVCMGTNHQVIMKLKVDDMTHYFSNFPIRYSRNFEDRLFRLGKKMKREQDRRDQLVIDIENRFRDEKHKTKISLLETKHSFRFIDLGKLNFDGDFNSFSPVVLFTSREMIYDIPVSVKEARKMIDKGEIHSSLIQIEDEKMISFDKMILDDDCIHEKEDSLGSLK